MSRRRHTPEQIIRKLADGHKLLAGGMTVEEVCREFAIAESTGGRWQVPLPSRWLLPRGRTVSSYCKASGRPDSQTS